MSLYVLLARDNPELLEKLPVEIRTAITMFNNELDKDLSSLIASDKYTFEKEYAELVNKLQSYIAQIPYMIANRRDAQKVIRQFQEIATSSLSQIEHRITDLSGREATILRDAIETLIEFHKIMDHPASIIYGFIIYVNLSVCIAALYEILLSTDNSYQKNRSVLVQRSTKCITQLKNAIEFVKSIEQTEETIKSSETYLSKKQLQTMLRKHITNEILNNVLRHLEFNNKIFYDKDGKIIWTEADKLQQRILKKEFTILR